jgi:hypothetical protein
MRFQRLSLCAAMLLGLVPAVHADPKVEAVAGARLPAPDPERTLVVLLREEYPRATGMKSDNLMLDGKPLGILPQRTFLVAKVEPGVHCLSGATGSRDLRFTSIAGEVCLLRLRERIDDRDQVVSDWLFDDAASTQALIGAKKLKLASTTESGANKLERVSQARPGDCGAPGTVDATAHPESSFVQLWYENPADRNNVKRDFTHATGTLVVTADGLRYRDKDLSLEVPIGKLRRVWFGGTRPNDPAPWVNVAWSGPDGAGVLSFADSRPAEATQTYDRLFRAVADLLARTTTPAEAETLYTAPRH